MSEAAPPWATAPLSALCSFQNGVNADRSAYGRGVRFINVLELITHPYLRADQIPGRVSLPSAVESAFMVEPGDLVFNRSSETPEEVGLASVYVGDEPVVFGGFVIRGRLLDERLSPRYAGYGLRAKSVRSQIIARGQGAIRANIGQNLLGQVEVPLPPLVEQEAIAEALFDADALIESLEQLIAKKRLIKQGVMQELLTGKRRLPGFETTPGFKQTEVGSIPLDWQATKLLSLVSIASGQVDPKTKPYRSMVLVAPDHIESKTGRLLARSTAAAQGAISGKYLVATGDVVYSKIRPHLRKAALVDFDALCSADMYPLRANDGVAPGFIFAVILGEHFSRFAESVSARSGMPKINRTELAEYACACPPTHDEQAAIGTVLRDMNAEIDGINQRLEKARRLKQGMMQQLLTGRIRLS